MKYIKITSWFLGISMFMVGVLKFVHPFKGWYYAQVLHSELGDVAYAMGIAGEIFVGILLISLMLLKSKIPTNWLLSTVAFSSSIIVIMMAVGMYVHFHPNVPGEVLPLKIKPPYIPAFFIVLALGNIYYAMNLITQSKKSLG